MKSNWRIVGVTIGKMNYIFQYDERLGICVPELFKKWESYSEKTQAKILFEWENIRGQIPDRIKEIEKVITEKQDLLNNEEDFEKSCQINAEIANYASIINDLWIWFRSTDQFDNR